MDDTIIYGPRAAKLRDPAAEQEIINFLIEIGSTASTRYDAIQWLIQEWHDDGNNIATAEGRLLDIELTDMLGETTMLDTKGLPISLEANVPLIGIDDAFGASPRRTVGHMKDKLGNPSFRRVSASNLSRLFWIDVAEKIFEHLLKE